MTGPNISPDEHVDVIKLMEQGFGIKSHGAWNLIHHGCVYIDGHCLRASWVKRGWKAHQLYGRVLKINGRGEMRILGSRLVRDLEQLTLA